MAKEQGKALVTVEGAECGFDEYLPKWNYRALPQPE